MGPRDIICYYEDITAVNILGFKNESIKSYKLFPDFPLEEQIAFTRKFAEETNMIVDESSWNDKQGIERIISKTFRFVK